MLAGRRCDLDEVPEYGYSSRKIRSTITISSQVSFCWHPDVLEGREPVEISGPTLRIRHIVAGEYIQVLTSLGLFYHLEKLKDFPDVKPWKILKHRIWNCGWRNIMDDGIYIYKTSGRMLDVENPVPQNVWIYPYKNTISKAVNPKLDYAVA